MTIQTIKIPDIGDFQDVEIIEVFVSVGDVLELESPLISIETDKAVMDVPSTHAGVVKAVHVSLGDKVSEGSLVLDVETAISDNKSADEEMAETVVMPTRINLQEESSATESVSSEPQIIKVAVPDIGDFSDVEVIEVFVNVGDVIEVESPLISMETDKAVMDVPSTHAGTVKAVHISMGDKVSQGTVVIDLETTGEPATVAQKTESSKPVIPRSAPPIQQITPANIVPAAAPKALPPINESSFANAYAGPSVRKLARELGVNLGQVKGDGIKGRITADNVKAFVKSILSGQVSLGTASALPKLPKVDFAKFGEIEVKPLSRIQKISSKHLQAAWINIPHVTQNDTADITDMDNLRKSLKAPALEQGIKITPLAFLIKAAVNVLKQFPAFNGSLAADEENMVFKNYYHIGFAADTPNGLVVPVIKNADQKNLFEIAKEMGDLSEKARAGKLGAKDMQGGTFTISSLGSIGGTFFTPIINAPEVAILGVARSKMEPVWDGKAFQPRNILPLSLSYDHRVIDGANAVRFTTALAKELENADALNDTGVSV